MIEKRCTVQLMGSTKNRLDQLGSKGETYDDIVKKGVVELENKSSHYIVNVPMSSDKGIIYLEVRVPKSLNALHVNLDELSDSIGGLCEDVGIKLLKDDEVPFF